MDLRNSQGWISVHVLYAYMYVNTKHVHVQWVNVKNQLFYNYY